MGSPNERSGDAAQPPTDANGLPVFAEDGTDLTVIRWMLAMSPEQRLRCLQMTMQAVNRFSRAEPHA